MTAQYPSRTSNKVQESDPGPAKHALSSAKLLRDPECPESYFHSAFAGPSPGNEEKGVTLRQAFELHITKIKNMGRAEATVAEYELAAVHLIDWLELPLKTLTRTMVRERHQKLGNDVGPYAANRRCEASALFGTRLVAKTRA
jgi:hypothetical protein